MPKTKKNKLRKISEVKNLKGRLVLLRLYLNKHLEVGFLPADDKTRQLSVIESMRDGSVIVLENLRRLKGEMENSLKFSKELAKPFELFINEDFAASHRKHASIVGLPKLLPSFIGSL